MYIEEYGVLYRCTYMVCVSVNKSYTYVHIQCVVCIEWYVCMYVYTVLHIQACTCVNRLTCLP
ncbi:hypothetical protein EON63_09305 [archaeon]|nr:MAG: hypothetical protein EON63_09305 [archaeon]